MIGSVEASVAAASPLNTQPAADLQPVGASSNDQVYDFQALVNGSGNASGSSAAVDGAVSSQPTTLGDAILKGMVDMKSRLDSGFHDLGDMSRGKSVVADDGSISYQIGSASDLVKMQVEAIKLGFELQLSGTIVNKSTQHVETFLKAQ